MSSSMTTPASTDLNKSGLHGGSASFDYSSWPPSLSPEQLHDLKLRSTTFALAHGLLYLPPHPPAPLSPPSTPSSAIHAPLSLLPAPLPKSLFERVQKLQSVYNTLYSNIATDVEFLDKVMGAEVGVGKVDEFTGNLWRGWKDVRGKRKGPQPLQLGLFRSDYLLHTSPHAPTTLKQVEFNTISSSFGPLAERAAAMHRHLAQATSYFNSSSYLSDLSRYPPNETTKGLAAGLAKAHEAYGKQSNTHILFVVQPNERNVFDQRWLEYELLERHNIRVIRQTFDDLASSASVHPDSNCLLVAGSEISVVYYRAAYTPTDFPSSSHYATRFLLEASQAINCPSIPLQLAGAKKVQEYLARPGVLETFLPSHSNQSIEELRETWMAMWSLDVESGLQKANSNHSKLVLKPQREGGGNNVYKESIPSFLESLPEKEREAWIAMELIGVPDGVGGYLVRAGSGSVEVTGGEEVVRTEVVSELGIFGWSLFGSGKEEGVVKEEDTIGWLVRTKGVESDEGGVATGFSVLDSIVLVDD